MPMNRTTPCSRLLAATLLVASLNLIGSCDTFNPFNPIAFVEVTAVSHSLAGAGGVTQAAGGAAQPVQGVGGAATLTTAGVLQVLTVDQQGSVIKGVSPQYTFSEPVVSLRNRPSAPEVRFKSVVVVFDLPGVLIPQKEFLNQFLLSQGTSSTAGAAGTTGTAGAGTQITLPIISLFAEEILTAVFPNDSNPLLRSGSARVFLKGTDINDHEIVVEFTTPLSFRQSFSTTTVAGVTPSPGATTTTPSVTTPQVGVPISTTPPPTGATPPPTGATPTPTPRAS